MSISIFEEFQGIRRSMLQHMKEPKRVTFNNEGYSRALMENMRDTVNTDTVTRTYCGLPYDIRPEQFGRIALHDNAPGRKSSMSAAQLCDIIREWLDADDATHWGEFEKALDRVVVEHGRFE